MKRIFSLLLALVLVIGLAPTAFAASKIIGANSPLDLNYGSTYLDSQPYNTEVVFPLTADMFDWDEDAPETNAVTKSQLDSARITLRTQVVKGSRVFNTSEIRIENRNGGALTNNKTTAHVIVPFVESLATTKEEEFEIRLFLHVAGRKASETEITLEGYMVLNMEYVSKDDEYYDVSDGSIVEATETISKFGLDVGCGVTVYTNMMRGQKYGGVCTSDVQPGDRFLEKFPNEFVTMLQLNMVNVTSGEAVIEFSGGSHYVYDGNGKYLGREGERVPFSSKYYLFSRQVDLGGGTVSSSTSTNSQASSQSSSGTTTTPQVTGENISVAAATQAAQQAVSSGTRTVQFKNAGSISGDALQAMNRMNNSLAVYADSIVGNSVKGRITILPSRTTGLATNAVIQLGCYVDDANTTAIQDFFQRWFSNSVTVVSLAQQGSFGFSVEIAAKVTPNAQNLVFYSYNKATNQYTQLSDTAHYLDANGYIHFTTSLGGDIIISGGTLTRK